jgi:predicted AAA+ superfamily ATPase
MFERYAMHNQFHTSLTLFKQQDPHLIRLNQMQYQYLPRWWDKLNFDTPGVYILTGGRQVGKSTSCKLLIKQCLENKQYQPGNILYLPCDEIFDAKDLSQALRAFLQMCGNEKFLLIIDEITYVPHWERVIKALADEGYFERGLCLLTGSDSLILKEAAMTFPGRRGNAAQVDFHFYPLSFREYVSLLESDLQPDNIRLEKHFQQYLKCGGYLKAINDLAQSKEISPATLLTYQQWIRGDFIKQGKNEKTLLSILQALVTISVSPISYSSLTQKIGLLSKETCIDYCRLLERMDVLIELQAYDQNKQQGFPRKDRKFHFADPFIYRAIRHWLKDEKIISNEEINQGNLVEACVASHCARNTKSFYFKGQGEIDVIWLQDQPEAIEIKWAEQIRPADLKMLKQFAKSIILTKMPQSGMIDHIKSMPVYRFLYDFCL